MNQVTEEDVLRGEKEIPVDRRDGKPAVLRCRALTWAASCKVSQAADQGDALILTLLSGLPKDQAKDEFLNDLTPESLSAGFIVILQLTNGLPGLKKARAAGKADGPSMPISSPPPANSANTDSADQKSSA